MNNLALVPEIEEGQEIEESPAEKVIRIATEQVRQKVLREELIPEVVFHLGEKRENVVLVNRILTSEVIDDLYGK